MAFSSNDLWSEKRAEARKALEPLAARMRPRTLDEFIGQPHILGGDGDEGERPLLRRMIEAGTLTSIILHGPPGTGKTTLARVIANTTDRHFVAENAAQVGVKRIREIVDDAARRVESGGPRTIVFLDEIHRFSKSQQDVLLDDVERGTITLIGATTENPLFTVNSALLSRSTLFRLEALSEDDVKRVVRSAIADRERGFGALDIEITDDALGHWAKASDGDARRALNALETAVLSSQQQARSGGDDGNAAVDSVRDSGLVSHHGNDALDQREVRGVEVSAEREEAQEGRGGAARIVIDLAVAQESSQRKAIRYDRQGDQHYDHASALIKSIRGSDPDAALYWMACMLEAGEDPRFIARRLAILASEDIGNADPRAIMVAQAAWDLVERIGLPEGRITLGHCVTYLALAPKSNASYTAINAAMADVQEGRTQPIPREIRDKTKAVSAGSAQDGKGYRYSHTAGERTSVGGVTDQHYLGIDARYYEPTDIGYEQVLKERLEEIRRVRGRADSE